MVICPRWFETGRWRLVDGVKEDLQVYWATEYGYAALAGQIGAGLESSSTDIVHELLHWWSFLGNFANAVIDDEAFKLENLGFDQDTQARTPWLAMQLKMRRPRLCVSQSTSAGPRCNQFANCLPCQTSNDENYMWFIREAFYTRRWDRPGHWWDPPQDMQPGDPYVTPDNRAQGFDVPI